MIKVVRWSVATLTSYLLGSLAARLLSSRHLQAIDALFDVDFGEDDE